MNDDNRSSLSRGSLSRRQREAWALRAAWAGLVIWLLAVVVQFQHGTMRRTSQGRQPTSAISQTGAAESVVEPPEKSTKGAISRWRKAVQGFWAGENIYLPVSQAVPGGVALHPNMPFIVILLTPLVHLPVWATTMVFNMLKLSIIAAAVWVCARLGRGDSNGVPPWAIVLGMVWAVKPIVSDIQHGNTNILVLGALVAHLWWYRRGWDLASGGALALAVCLKLTPAMFLAYWLYQRNWKLLAGAAVAMVIFLAVVPSMLLGPARCGTLTQTWWENLIRPGLIEGSWYPIHVNQSISGVMGRYLLDGPGGDIYWGPDDHPYPSQQEHGWITLLALPGWGAKLVVRVLQLGIVAAMAWAIGWRKLPRDDPRRLPHYAMVVLAMMLLNQRTWEHHAAVGLIAGMGIWMMIFSGQAGAAGRRWAVGLAVAALVCLWGNGGAVSTVAAWLAGRSTEVGKDWADRLDAYGPTFYYFLLLFLASVVLARSTRRAEPVW